MNSRANAARAPGILVGWYLRVRRPLFSSSCSMVTIAEKLSCEDIFEEDLNRNLKRREISKRFFKEPQTIKAHFSECAISKSEVPEQTAAETAPARPPSRVRKCSLGGRGLSLMFASAGQMARLTEQEVQALIQRNQEEHK